MTKTKNVKSAAEQGRAGRWLAAIAAVVLIGASGAALLLRTHAATGGALSLTPVSGTAQVGSTVSVTVMVNSGTDAISTVQADLTYPSALLQYTSITATGSVFNDVAPAPTTGVGTLSITRATTTAVSGSQQFVTVNFTVLAAGSANIGFANSSAIYRQSDAVNIYSTSTGAVFTLVLPPVAGDVNGDRHVTAADIAVILSHWNQTGMVRTTGDLSGDGKVSAVDIAILLTNWGA